MSNLIVTLILIFCHYLLNIAKGELRIEKSTILLNFRCFTHIPPDTRFDSKAIQKTPILLHRYVTSLIRSTRPLEPAVAQPQRKEAKTDSLEEETLDSVFLYSAKKKQRSLFQRIQPI